MYFAVFISVGLRYEYICCLAPQRHFRQCFIQNKQPFLGVYGLFLYSRAGQHAHNTGTVICQLFCAPDACSQNVELANNNTSRAKTKVRSC